MSARNIVLTDEQEIATALIYESLSNPEKFRPFSLHGLAGSGKSTVLAQIALDIPHAILCTLTGKAASVLRRKTGLLSASTIHAAFYQLTEASRDKVTGRRDLRFETVHERGQLADKIVLIDESSMINHDMARDIMRTGAKIVVSGDPGQLSPVKGGRFFDYADFTLRTIHRQALESPIIRQAHRVRQGHHYRNDGDGFRVLDRAFTIQEILDADVILTYTNATRHVANRYARLARGINGPPRVNEPVMCMRNARPYGVFNGAVYKLLRDFNPGDSSILIDADGRDTSIPMVRFDGIASTVPADLETTWFDHGYAMTVHKAQGSEWNNVLFLDEYFKREERDAFVYTAITRAAERISITSHPFGYEAPPPLPF
jgi:exodeoxyribonuclease-5